MTNLVGCLGYRSVSFLRQYIKFGHSERSVSEVEESGQGIYIRRNGKRIKFDGSRSFGALRLLRMTGLADLPITVKFPKFGHSEAQLAKSKNLDRGLTYAEELYE